MHLRAREGSLQVSRASRLERANTHERNGCPSTTDQQPCTASDVLRTYVTSMSLAHAYKFINSATFCTWLFIQKRTCSPGGGGGGGGCGGGGLYLPSCVNHVSHAARLANSPTRTTSRISCCARVRALPGGAAPKPRRTSYHGTMVSDTIVRYSMVTFGAQRVARVGQAQI